MMKSIGINCVALFIMLLAPAVPGLAQSRVLDARLHHLRNGSEPEWAVFPAQAEAGFLEVNFLAEPNTTAYTLQLRQQDVKQTWQVLLNNKVLGALVVDEKDMLTYLSVPAGALQAGENHLRIQSASKSTDDIRVGQILLDHRDVNQLLSEAAVQITVTEKSTRQSLPARLTLVTTTGTLQPVRARQPAGLAVRTGVIYTGNGQANLTLPAGKYRLYAGRGFEYSVDSVDFSVQPGGQVSLALTIEPEVPTPGWISTDTHVHTFTHSGHGDATVAERVLTLAGEGIELPILTDHNKRIAVNREVQELGLQQYLLPVMGSEITTPVGHFNIFPVKPETPEPAYQAPDWNTLQQSLGLAAREQVLILNHARDIHGSFRPFDPKHHVAPAGRSLTGWTLPANAMEVINSGALQTDNHQLLHDWMGMLNGGHNLTPIGSSDSHDVSRYIVGQGRTYVRSTAATPSAINVAEAVANIQAGKVTVSLGLLTEITVNQQYGPGELAPASPAATVKVQVSGPGWVRANRVTLYANGQKVQEAIISNQAAAGLKYSGSWQIPIKQQDVFLVAVAEGPAGEMPFWPLVKPYLPMSPHWQPLVMGISGAVWIDADQNHQKTSAATYARQILAAAKGDPKLIIRQLKNYDEAVALAVASQLQEQGQDPTAPAFTRALQKAKSSTQAGFAQFSQAWETTRQAAARRR